MAWRVRNTNTGKAHIVGTMDLKRYGRLPHYTVEGECDRRGNLLSPTKPSGPTTADRKAVWVAHAVACGADRDDAEAMTKDELIDQYGG